MIQTDDTVIESWIVHYINSEEKSVILNDEPVSSFTESQVAALKKIFLKPFHAQSSTNEFHHEVNLDYNVLFNISKAVQGGEDFTAKSKDVMHHLASTSKHQNIKNGDIFIVKFSNIELNNGLYNGLGIYKFESKESFIETAIDGNGISHTYRKGIGAKKPDKACLIIFTEGPYTILTIDNGKDETDYWHNEFIKHRPKKDNVNQTNNFLSLTKSFITGTIDDEFEVTKADKIDLLNRSVDYFKKHESFNKEEFEQEVFYDNNVIESFRRFDENYRRENEMELTDEFEISPQAVKKQARAFKSVLKLDKNFHVYIHGDRDLIEQGIDEDGRKFYKIYYKEEH